MLTLAQIRFCAMECERQQTSPSAVADMCVAFEHAHFLTSHDPRGFLTVGFIKRLGYLVDPVQNEYGFRVMPVYFGDPTRQALPAEQIEQALNSLIKHGQHLSAEEGYFEFEKIHPFNDGNGRVGAILYNIFKDTLGYPLLPPDMFGNPNEWKPSDTKLYGDEQGNK